MAVAFDRELARPVYEDLAHLQENWNQQATDAVLRRESTVLRRLLVDGHLSRVASSIGIKYRLQVGCLCEFYTTERLKGYEYWMAPYVKYKGAAVQMASIRNRAVTENELKIEHEARKALADKSKAISVPKYLQLPAMVVEGIIVRHQGVIQFVCNKLGGAHYDRSRKRQRDQQFVLLDKVRSGDFQVLGKDAVYLQLLGVGQAIATNQITYRVMSRLRSMGIEQPSKD